MRFLRHLLAAAALAAAVVGMGIAWGHSPLASVVSDDHRRDGFDPDRSDGSERDRAELDRRETGRLETDRADGSDRARFERERRGDHGVSLSNADELAMTVVSTGVLMTGVIVIDRRRRRPVLGRPQP
ncbi:MAG: hypothetical protein IPG46_17335 [Actinobacteria bacterium]|nr:hypothetical protein [Actinomycetota bacterium]